MPDHLVHVVEPWLAQYGYAALFAVLFLEGIGIPAPGLTFVIACVLLAASGGLRPGPVVGLALAGALCGCHSAFLIGRRGGRRWLLRSGLLDRHRLRRLQHLFRRWGPPLLVVAPFLDGTRQYAALAAGAAHMPWARFARYNLAGLVLWIGGWSLAAYRLGPRLEPLLGLVYRLGPWLFAGGLACLLVLLGIRHSLRAHGPTRYRRETARTGSGPAAGRVSCRTGDRTRRVLLLGAVSYAVFVILVSLPFWGAGRH